jgi:hypothetical protein
MTSSPPPLWLWQIRADTGVCPDGVRFAWWLIWADTGVCPYGAVFIRVLKQCKMFSWGGVCHT